MTYFADLSFYTFVRGDSSPGAKNVGWLERGHQFQRIAPSEDILDSLWSLCAISVMQTRGIHQCDLCDTPQTVYAVRNGVRVLLGTSEIRVFPEETSISSMRQTLPKVESNRLLFLRASRVPFGIYAAPTPIYHYIRTHHYKPADEFLCALRDGPRPPAPEYSEYLKQLNLEWKTNWTPDATPADSGHLKTQEAGSRNRAKHSIYLDES